MAKNLIKTITGIPQKVGLAALLTIGGIADTRYEEHLLQAASAVMPLGCATLGEKIKQETEINQTLYQKNSRSPEIAFNAGRRQDFDGHLRRDTAKFPGIDYIANSNTDIVAAEEGYVTRIEVRTEEEKHTSANKVIVDHGFGYRTYYAHMDEVNAKVDFEVKRGQKLGRGGSTGLGEIHHNHFTLYGPDYTPHLKNIKQHDTGNTTYHNVWRYILDPEQFSPMPNAIPYLIPGIDLGKPLIQKAKEETPRIHQILKEIRKEELGYKEKQKLEQLYKDDRQNQWFLQYTGIDRLLDRKITYIYELVNKEKPPFKNPEEIKNYIIQLMKTMVPILTAPITPPK